jgi:hypothetical protein
MKTQNLIHKMLTTNTGIAMGDSGGDSGRQWQKNQGKSIKDFQDQAEAWLDTKYGLDVTISVFHHLVKTLDQDELCQKFNKLPCNDWDGDFYGTSKKQCEWLEKNDFIKNPYRAEFNTYNFDSNLSQVLQGTFLRQGGYVDDYVLLQIHGGADVRGGYTDAKLFKVDSDYFLFESASFDIGENKILDICGGDYRIYNTETGEDKYLDYSGADELCKSLGDSIIRGYVTY